MNRGKYICKQYPTKKKIGWTLLGTGSSQSLPSVSYSEILVCILYINSGNTRWDYSIIIPQQECSEYRRFFNGYGYGGVTNLVSVQTDGQGNIQLLQCMIDGADLTSSATMKVYYR